MIFGARRAEMGEERVYRHERHGDYSTTKDKEQD
jgi:hypothetical protein